MVQLPAELADEVDAQRLAPAPGPTMISRPVSQGKAALERSVSLTRCSSSRAFGPGEHQHAASRRSGSRSATEPSSGMCFLQPVVVEALPGAGRDQIEAAPAASRKTVNSECTPPRLFSAWQRCTRPTFFGMRLATRRSRNASAPRPGDARLGERRHVLQADVLHATLPALVRRRARTSFERRNDQWSVLRHCPSGANQFGRSQPNLAEHRAQRLHAVVAGRRPQRPRRPARSSSG